jgi:hypothetical protein
MFRSIFRALPKNISQFAKQMSTDVTLTSTTKPGPYYHALQWVEITNSTYQDVHGLVKAIVESAETTCPSKDRPELLQIKKQLNEIVAIDPANSSALNEIIKRIREFGSESLSENSAGIIEKSAKTGRKLI